MARCAARASARGMSPGSGSSARWRAGERGLDVATRYDLVELSLVDNPSNPRRAGLTFVRDAVPDAAVLDVVDEASSDVLPDGLVTPTLPGMDGSEPHTRRRE